MLTKPLSELIFTVVDIETTGFFPKYAKLVEIAAIKIKTNFTIDLNDNFSHLINPLCKINYDAYQIHGISNEMVENKPTIDKIIPEFCKFSKNTILVAHNAGFDMSFINAAILENNLSPTHIGVIDTVRLAKKTFPGYKSYSLDNIIKNFNINIDVEDSYRHRALFDAAHTAQLFVKCLKELDKRGKKFFHEI